MISFPCTHCGKALKIKPELAGKKVKCPGCGQATAVPSPVPGARATSEKPKSVPPPAPPEAILPLRCHKCDRAIPTTPEQAGKRVRCPACGRAATVPGRTAKRSPRTKPTSPATSPTRESVAPSRSGSWLIRTAKLCFLAFRVKTGREVGRQRAVEALGGAGDRRAVNLLLAALRDPSKGVREAAALALSRVGDTGSIRPIVVAAVHPDRNISNEVAVSALARFGVEAVAPLLAETVPPHAHLNTFEGDHREKLVAAALIQIGEPAVDPLLAALPGAQPWELQAIARALGSLGDARAVGPLSDALHKPPRRKERRALSEVADALGLLGDLRAAEPLLEDWKKDGYPSGHRALRALADLGVGVVPLLLEFFQQGDSQVRGPLAEVLADLRDARAVEPLINSLADEKEELRKAAAEALVRLSDARAVFPLLVALREGKVLLPGIILLPFIDMVGKLGDAQVLSPLRWGIPSWSDSQGRDTIQQVLQRNATSASEENLRALAVREDIIELGEMEYAPCGLPLGHRRFTIDFGHIRQLARQELIRRGIKL